jgi:hypothetical protein
VIALALLFALALLPQRALCQGQRVADLELALLVDVSASVSDAEFRLQARGFAAAFRSAPVAAALAASAPRGIAVMVGQWAGNGQQRRAVDWTLLRGEADLFAFAARIEVMPRLIQGGPTAISNALLFGLEEIEANGYSGYRRVIDLSGDGRNNDGYRLHSARETVLGREITINGLAILNELPLSGDYFRDYVIGGDGAFYIVADDYPDFAVAMTQKLWREIKAVPISRNEGAPGVRLAGVK